MIAIAKPMPVPGNWKNARTASNRAKPAMIIVNVRAHGWSAHRPTGREQPDDPGGDREPAPQPDALVLGQVAEDPEPVEAEDPQAIEQEAESGECREEAEDRNENWGIFHWLPSFKCAPVIPREHKPHLTTAALRHRRLLTSL